MSNIDKDSLKRLNLIIEKTKGYENVAFPIGTNGEFGALYISDLKGLLSELKKEREGRNILAKLNKEIFDELETYKKIAEKLVERAGDYGIIPKCEKCSYEDSHECIECIIDWARNEVENGKT